MVIYTRSLANRRLPGNGIKMQLVSSR